MKETLKYVARSGFRISNRDAAILGPVFEKIPRKKRTASNVVCIARKIKSPLHRFFEWDDTQAAREHRLYQARNLLNSYKVVIVSNGKESRPLPALISVSHATQQHERTGEREYVTILELSRDEVLAQQYLESLVSDIITLANKHEAVREFVKCKSGVVNKQLQSFFAIADQLHGTVN